MGAESYVGPAHLYTGVTAEAGATARARELPLVGCFFLSRAATWQLLFSYQRQGVLQRFAWRTATTQTREAAAGHLLARSVLTDGQRQLAQQQLSSGDVARRH